ncbi:MAG TPA: hypothetical protein HPQ00_13745 [Magnetococcales bacterium]|nr:hypothetical protein [Magnetococcales bacterium]
MSLFNDLPPSHQASLVALRERTTYLWPEIQQACRAEGSTLTCQIRAKTLNQVEGALDNLRNAGFFDFRKHTNDHGDNPQLYRLQMQDITERFKEIVNSMDESIHQVKPVRSGGLLGKIKSLFRGT